MSYEAPAALVPRSFGRSLSRHSFGREAERRRKAGRSRKGQHSQTHLKKQSQAGLSDVAPTARSGEVGRFVQIVLKWRLASELLVFEKFQMCLASIYEGVG